MPYCKTIRYVTKLTPGGYRRKPRHDMPGFDSARERLCHARLARRCTPQELAKLCGVKDATFRDYREGRTSIPVKILFRAAFVLDVPRAWLVHGEGPVPVEIPPPIHPCYVWVQETFKQWYTRRFAIPAGFETEEQRLRRKKLLPKGKRLVKN